MSNRIPKFDLSFDSYKDPFSDLFKPMPFWKLMKIVNKTIARGRRFTDKYEAAIASCSNRTKSVPQNATIRKEYVRCKKPDCCYDRHGPFHYAYWKDPVTKKLKKKYIGRHFEKEDKSATRERNQSKSEQEEKKELSIST